MGGRQRRTVSDAERLGDTGLLAEMLGGLAVIRFLCGDGLDENVLARALALEDPYRQSGAVRWPLLHAALVHFWTHRPDQARVELSAVRQRCIDLGAESDLWFVSY